MLTALIISMLLSSGNIEIFGRDDFRNVSRAIEESDRLERVQTSMERINAKVDTLGEIRNAVFVRFKDVDDPVGSTLADYEALFDRLWQARREAQAAYIDEVFAMRGNMSREEWTRVFGGTATAYTE